MIRTRRVPADWRRHWLDRAWPREDGRGPGRRDGDRAPGYGRSFICGTAAFNNAILVESCTMIFDDAGTAIDYYRASRKSEIRSAKGPLPGR